MPKTLYTMLKEVNETRPNTDGFKLSFAMSELANALTESIDALPESAIFSNALKSLAERHMYLITPDETKVAANKVLAYLVDIVVAQSKWDPVSMWENTKWFWDRDTTYSPGLLDVREYAASKIVPIIAGIIPSLEESYPQSKFSSMPGIERADFFLTTQRAYRSTSETDLLWSEVFLNNIVKSQAKVKPIDIWICEKSIPEHIRLSWLIDDVLNTNIFGFSTTEINECFDTPSIKKDAAIATVFALLSTLEKSEHTSSRSIQDRASLLAITFLQKDEIEKVRNAASLGVDYETLLSTLDTTATSRSISLSDDLTYTPN